MTRPFVLHVRSATGYGGGPEKTILNSPRFLGPLGYDSACAYLHHHGDGQELARRAEIAQARFISVPDRGPLHVSLPVQLAKICRANNVAIWHAHDYKTNVLGLFVRRLRPVKLVSTVHGWGVQGGRTPLYYRIDKWALRFYDQVVCVSQDLQAECLRVGVKPSRCHLAHNAIDTDEFAPSRESIEHKRRLGIAPETLLVGGMGRLSPEKGFEQLIQAVDRVITEGSDAALLIAGEGPCREKLQEAITATGQQGRIRLLGQVNDVVSFFHALDIFVLSSLREGLPNVLLEAMACGVPVIATRVGGVPTLLQDGVNGMLIEAGSVDAIIGALRALIDDRTKNAALVRAARQTIERSFSFAERMKKVAGVYEELQPFV